MKEGSLTIFFFLRSPCLLDEKCSLHIYTTTIDLHIYTPSTSKKSLRIYIFPLTLVEQIGNEHVVAVLPTFSCYDIVCANGKNFKRKL